MDWAGFPPYDSKSTISSGTFFSNAIAGPLNLELKDIRLSQYHNHPNPEWILFPLILHIR
jgi:hypothetical protein